MYTWRTPLAEPLGAVQIAHGVAEHARRYDRLARALNTSGYHVYANDHRGHGGSTGSPVGLGSFGSAGWAGLVDDVVSLTRAIADENPDLPRYLVGHSMGSFAAQDAIVDHSACYSGVALSGSTAIDRWVERLADADFGDDLNGFLNAGFDHRTGYEWLSRDSTEVDAYVRDPLCGFEIAGDTIPALFSSAARLARPDVLAAIRPDLPVLILSGAADPAAGSGELVELLARRYREAGLGSVKVRLYPGARHEIFNERNRDEVADDLIQWLGQQRH